MSPSLAIFGQSYDCYRNGVLIGTATYEDSEEIGPAFISMSIDKDGRIIHEVTIPDNIEIFDHV